MSFFLLLLFTSLFMLQDTTVGTPVPGKTSPFSVLLLETFFIVMLACVKTNHFLFVQKPAN